MRTKVRKSPDLERKKRLEYYKRYYRKHRKDLLEAKRKRYQEDPAYRESIRRRSRVRGEILKKMRRKWRDKDFDKKPLPRDARPKVIRGPKIAEIHGKKQPLFPAGILCKEAKVSKTTLFHMLRKKMVPPPDLLERTQKGYRRWFTWEYIQRFRKGYSQVYELGLRQEEMGEAMTKAFFGYSQELPVRDAAEQTVPAALSEVPIQPQVPVPSPEQPQAPVPSPEQPVEKVIEQATIDEVARLQTLADKPEETKQPQPPAEGASDNS